MTNKKLPVMKVLLGAFVVPWRHKNALLGSLLYPTVVLTFLGLLLFYRATEWHVSMYWLLCIVYLAAFVIFAITTHRTILLGDKSLPPYGLNRWSRREFIFFGWSLGVSLVCTLIVAVSVSIALTITINISDVQMSSGSTVGRNALPEWVNTIAMIPGTYVLARLSLVFPATAVDKISSFKWSWQITRGNSWRMLIVVGVLPWVLSFLVESLWREGASVPEVVILFLIGYLLFVIEISALSLSYRELSDGREVPLC